MTFFHYRTLAVFLKKEERGEADQLFWLYTQNFGKLEVLARSIRKIKSKLRSGADLFLLSEIEFIQGKTHKTLTDAILIEKFKTLKKSLKSLSFAYKIADVLDNLVGKEEKDEKIWQLLIQTFFLLNQPELGGDQEFSYYFFLWKLFSFLGYHPQLYFCPVCEKKLLPETFWFSPHQGGVVCWNCFKNFKPEEKKSFQEIKVETVKILRLLVEKDWSFVARVKREKEEIDNLKKISELYLNFLKEFSKPGK